MAKEAIQTSPGYRTPSPSRRPTRPPQLQRGERNSSRSLNNTNTRRTLDFLEDVVTYPLDLDRISYYEVSNIILNIFPSTPVKDNNALKHKKHEADNFDSPEYNNNLRSPPHKRRNLNEAQEEDVYDYPGVELNDHYN